jgi:hypothetical protein
MESSSTTWHDRFAGRCSGYGVGEGGVGQFAWVDAPPALSSLISIPTCSLFITMLRTPPDPRLLPDTHYITNDMLKPPHAEFLLLGGHELDITVSCCFITEF